MPAKEALAPELKHALDELHASVANYAPKSTVDKLQAQVDGIDKKMAVRHVVESVEVPLIDSLKQNESVSRLMRDRRGTAVIHVDGKMAASLMGHKAIISAVASGSSEGDPLYPVGVQSTGVLRIDRTLGITPEARQTLKVGDVLSARPTTMQVVDFVRVSTPMSIASPVPEASIKPENQVTFSAISEKVRLIATWIPATKQVLDDFQELLGFITTTLPYYINLEEELQLLAGDGTGENLHGLLPQAQPFNAGLLSPAAGWNRIDVIGRAVQQINANKEIDPTFVILNTNDWWAIRLTKDSFGRYLLGDPQTTVRPNIFGLDVVATTSIASGNFLVGSGNPVAAEIRDRMDMQVEISTENQDYFIRNLVAIRAEKRMALLTKRPNSFVAGTFTTSP